VISSRRSQNIGLYVGIDQALSLTDGTASSAAALARYPDRPPQLQAGRRWLSGPLRRGRRSCEPFLRVGFSAPCATQFEYGSPPMTAAAGTSVPDALAVLDHIAEPVEGIPFWPTRFLQSATPAAWRSGGGSTGRRAAARPR
jgi:hypothetical protein